MSPGAWFAIVAVGAAACAVAWLYNRLVSHRNLVRQGFADIDVQLKRRADLVPLLVDAVRGYASHERTLLAAITEVRARAVNADAPAERFEQERALGDGLKQLLLLQEAYPDLKADQNFRQLAGQLVDLEDHLQMARRFYNGAVKQYRTRIESFPDLLVARPFGFDPLPYFETDARTAVPISL